MDKSEMMNEIEALKQRLSNLEKELMESETLESKLWKPKFNKSYYFIECGNMKIEGSTWKDDYTDKVRYACGNCFKTRTSAIEMIGGFQIGMKLQQYRDVFCPEYTPDWTDFSAPKYYVTYDYSDNKFISHVSYADCDPMQVYFSNREIADNAARLLDSQTKLNNKNKLKTS